MPSAQQQVWALPPMCGVLGVALVWHLPDPGAGREEIRQVVRGQLRAWGAEPYVSPDVVELALDEMVASALRHGAGPLFVELSGVDEALAVAVRTAGAGDWAQPSGEGLRGLEGAAALADELLLLPLPDGSGFAYVVRFFFRTALANAAADRASARRSLAGPPVRVPRRPTRLRDGGRRCPTPVLIRTDGWPCQNARVNATLGGPRGPAAAGRRVPSPPATPLSSLPRSRAASR